MTENKSSKWPERNSNLGPPDCKSDALTTQISQPLLLFSFELFWTMSLSWTHFLHVSWCFGNHFWFAFVLLCGYCPVSFQSLVLHHLVITPIHDTKKLPFFHKHLPCILMWWHFCEHFYQVFWSLFSSFMSLQQQKQIFNLSMLRLHSFSKGKGGMVKISEGT